MMRWVILFLMMIMATGCCKTKIITVCPAPTNVPADNEYQTDRLPPTATSAVVIKAILEDLIVCQNTEERLRVVLGGYK